MTNITPEVRKWMSDLGKKSAKSRLKGKSKEEIKQIMRTIRLTRVK